MARISIIIPIYNTEKYIGECIESVINQTFKDWELILVDDGSTDKSGLICNKYSLPDKRIRYIAQSNKGQCAARNLGIDESSGEFLMFMDADDTLVPNALKVCYDYMIDNQVDVVCAECMSISSDGSLYKYSRPSFVNRIVDNVEYLKMILTHSTLCSIWAKLYRRSFIGSNRFLKKADRGVDVIFWSMVLPLKHSRILLSSDKIYKYRILSQSVSHGNIEKQISKLHVMNDNLKYTKSLLKKENHDLAVYYDNAILYNIDEILKKQGFIKKINSDDVQLIKNLYPSVLKQTNVRYNKSWEIIVKQTNSVTIIIILSIGYIKHTLRQFIKRLIYSS